MAIDEWSILIGVAMSTAMTVGPWMFKVHGKLAEIAGKMADLCEKLESSAADQRRLWEISAQHESRLASHDVQLAHMRERLRDAPLGPAAPPPKENNP